LSFFASGGNSHQLEAMILGSDEFFQTQGGNTNAGFTSALYQHVLNRPADASGMSTANQALANGMTRTALALAIITSQESATDETSELFAQFLHRNADASGMNSFSTALHHGTTLEFATAAMLSSQEYFNDAQDAA